MLKQPQDSERLKSLVIGLGKGPLTDDALNASKGAVLALTKARKIEELGDIAVKASDAVAMRVVSSLESIKAVEELRYLGMNASEAVAIQVVSSLESLKAVEELKFLKMHNNSKSVAELARVALERLERPQPSNENIVREIKVLLGPELPALGFNPKQPHELKHLIFLVNKLTHMPPTDEILRTSETVIAVFERVGADNQLGWLGQFTPDPIATQAVSALERIKAVNKLKWLAFHGSKAVSTQAISAMEGMLPGFIENKDFNSLIFLEGYASKPVIKQVVLAVETMLPHFIEKKWIEPLIWLEQHGSKAVAKRTRDAMDRLYPSSTAEIIREINAICVGLNKPE